jgi:membrane-bound lytic murein transglycosylase D
MRFNGLLALVAVALQGGCALTPSVPAPVSVAAHLALRSAAASAEPPAPVEAIDFPIAVESVQVFPVSLAPPEVSAAEVASQAEPLPLPEPPSLLPPPTDLWDRLRRGFAMPRLETRAAEQFARHFAATGFLLKTESRARRYLYYFLEEIERRGLPTELALLPFVESSMNPHARSQVGAMGAWQFMPATGRRFDMRVSHLVDDRKSVLESTRGAMAYLESLYAQFGDWSLALASYNWGEQNVARAQERNRSRGLRDDYLSLTLPRETRNYVPQLEGLKRLILDPARYGATLPAIPNEPYFREVAVGQDMDVDLALRFAGITEAEFFALNAAVRRPLVIAAATPRLLLPHGAAERFEARRAAHAGPTASWTAIRLGESQRVETLAARMGIGAQELRRLNGIPPGMKPTVGSSVIVPKSEADGGGVAGDLVQNAYLNLSPEVKRITVRVRRGETLSGIAARLGVRPADLARWNPGTTPASRLKAGQQLVAFVRLGRERSRASHRAGSTASIRG